MSTPCLIAVRLKKSEKDQTTLVERFNGTFPAATETYKYVINKETKRCRAAYSRVNRNKKLMERALKTYKNCPVSMDGDYLFIYCHWDGATRLETLQNCFQTYEKALQLVMLGSCSYVDEKGVMPYMLAPLNVGSKDWETDNTPTAVNDIYDPKLLMCGVNYLYVFDDRREDGQKWKLKRA